MLVPNMSYKEEQWSVLIKSLLLRHAKTHRCSTFNSSMASCGSQPSCVRVHESSTSVDIAFRHMLTVSSGWTEVGLQSASMQIPNTIAHLNISWEGGGFYHTEKWEQFIASQWWLLHIVKQMWVLLKLGNNTKITIWLDRTFGNVWHACKYFIFLAKAALMGERFETRNLHIIQKHISCIQILVFAMTIAVKIRSKELAKLSRFPSSSMRENQ